MSTIADKQALLRGILRRDLGTFNAKVFQTVSPGDSYDHTWSHDALTHALMQVHRGEIRRLVVTMPPRSGKSIFASVGLIAWWLGHDPRKRFVCTSYSFELAVTLARQFRSVTTSDWYQLEFPNVQLIKDTETECVTSEGGGRFAIPIGGSFMGRGGDVVVIDDPIKSKDAQSEKARRGVNDWFRETLLPRLDDKKNASIVLLMQRLNEDDLAGMLLQEDTWSHLNLPAIAEEDQDIAIGPGVVYHRKQNEVLHPEREPLSVLQNIKREMGSIPFSSQFQQRPIPLQGNVVKRGWLKWYTSAPVREDGAEVVQSWDVASTAADTGDWSVCSTWMVKRRTYYLLDVWRGRLEFPALKRKLIELAREWAPNRILIERAGPGLHLIQELLANPVPDVPAPIGINPEGCKRARMEAQSARFEAGQVYLPEQGPWLGEFLNEVLGFPSTRHDDQVDSTSQFLGWAEKRHRWDSPLSTYAGRDLVRYLDGCVVIG